MFSRNAVRKAAAAMALLMLTSFFPALRVNAEKTKTNNTNITEIMDEQFPLGSLISIMFPRAIKERSMRSLAPEIYDYTSTEHSVTISWKGISDADGYYIFLTDKDKTIPAVCTSGDATTAVIDNLSAGIEYSFRVQAFRYSGGEIRIEGGFAY